MINVSVDWSFTTLFLEDISVVSNSYGGGGGGGGTNSIVNALTPTLPAVFNNVTIALPPALPTPSDPTPTITAVQATNTDSQTAYGEQAGPVVMTLLSSVEAAQTLATYVGRPLPVYWYSEIKVILNRLTGVQQDAVANLEIGDQITVSKRFVGVASPVVQQLFVEAVEHEIRPSGHTVVITTSPAALWEPFELGTSELDDVLYGLG